MKKLFLIIAFLTSTVLYALDEKSTLKVYDKLLSVLIPQKNTIHVYVSDQEYKNALKKEKKIVFVDRFEDADFILLSDESTLEQYKQYRKRHPEHTALVFATKYRFLKNCHDAVGALYWRKGRSQLLFIAPRLKHYNITLPPSFEKFEIEAL